MRPTIVLVGGPDVDARLDLMTELREQFELTALGTDPALADRFAAAGFGYATYPMKRGVDPLGDLAARRWLRQYFLAHPPTVVHSFDTKPGVWARLAAAAAGVPVVVGTLPGLGSLYADRSLQSRAVRTIYQPLQRWACRRSQCTIFQNGDDREEFIRRGIVAAGNARVIRGSGVRPERFAAGRYDGELPALRQELGLPAGTMVVTMIARVMRSKGVLEFAEAARRLKAVNANLVCLLVGEADETGLDRLAPTELDTLRQSVQWLGARRDVPALLALTDLFVLPSYYREGVPRVLLEAAASGVPLIAARAPGSTDVVRDGWNGVLVPPRDPVALADAMARLTMDADTRQLYGTRSRQLVAEEFALTVVAGQLRETYRELLAGRTSQEESR